VPVKNQTLEEKGGAMKEEMVPRWGQKKGDSGKDLTEDRMVCLQRLAKYEKKGRDGNRKRERRKRGTFGEKRGKKKKKSISSRDNLTQNQPSGGGLSKKRTQ